MAAATITTKKVKANTMATSETDDEKMAKRLKRFDGIQSATITTTRGSSATIPVDGESKSSSTTTSQSYAYVCLVMKGDGYVAGALATAHSIRQSGSRYAIVCMVTSDVSVTARERLSLFFDRVVEISYMKYACHPLRTQKQRDMYATWVGDAFTKWHMLKLTEYKKCMFVDADKIVFSNLDHLFELPCPAGTFSSPWAEPWVKASKSNGFRRGLSNPYHGNVRHGKAIPRRCIDQGLRSSFVVIGTVLIVEPSIEHFEAFHNMMQNRNVYGNKGCHSMMDEQSITEFYHHELKKQWTFIHQQYNAVPWKPDWMEGRKPRLYHYFNKKPWTMERGTWLDCEAYWRFVEHLVCLERLTIEQKELIRGAFPTQALKHLFVDKGELEKATPAATATNTTTASATTTAATTTTTTAMTTMTTLGGEGIRGCAWCKECCNKEWTSHDTITNGQLTCPELIGPDE